MPNSRITKVSKPRHSKRSPRQEAPCYSRKGAWAFWAMLGCVITLIFSAVAFLAAVYH